MNLYLFGIYNWGKKDIVDYNLHLDLKLLDYISLVGSLQIADLHLNPNYLNLFNYQFQEELFRLD